MTVEYAEFFFVLVMEGLVCLEVNSHFDFVTSFAFDRSKMGLLKDVFGEAFIPEEVKVEVVDRGKELGERDAYVVEKAIKDGWLEVSRAELVEVPIKLELGEVAVLSLAKKLGVREVLIDEVSARIAARLMGLTPRGTIYVLLKALEKKEMDLDKFLEA